MMKRKIGFLAGLFLALCAATFAQDFDARIQAAVDELAATLKFQLEVVVDPITIEGTDTPSALSRFLHGRVEYSASKNVAKYRVTPKSRGTRRAEIKGSYQEIGNNVEVTLSLVSDTGSVIGTALLKLPTADLKDMAIEWLPENRKTQAEAVRQEKLIAEAAQQTVPSPAKIPANTAAVFTLEAWPNSDSYTFFDGDKMQISLYASKDCYFKVYYVDAQNQRQLIYPNPVDKNNRLQANKVRAIPDGTEYVMGSPFGVESIFVIASDKPLEYAEAEMMPIAASRGMTQRLAENNGAKTSVGAGAIVETNFSYTILPKRIAEEKLSYQKPDNMGGFVREFRNTVQQDGGTFNGNEHRGTFTTGHFSGEYTVTDMTIEFSIRHPIEESLSRGNSSNTRGVGGNYNFSFSKPANIAQAVQTVRSGIESKGGTFSGNENAGSFKASGISGNYNIQNAVSVTILEKPFVIPNSMIENEVKKFFGVK
jgi:hypothetical protein